MIDDTIMVTKNKYSVIFICLIFLLCLIVKTAMAEDYAKNVETGEANIDFAPGEFPPVAYIRVEFKNTGDKKISNLDFEISYYDKDGFLIKKALVKNALTEAIPRRESRKYKIRLNGDVSNVEHEQYPYSRQTEVDEFDIKVKNVKLTSG